MTRLALLFGLAGLLIASPLLPAAVFGAGHTQFESAAVIVVAAIMSSGLGWFIGLIVGWQLPPSRRRWSRASRIARLSMGHGERRMPPAEADDSYMDQGSLRVSRAREALLEPVAFWERCSSSTASFGGQKGDDPGPEQRLAISVWEFEMGIRAVLATCMCVAAASAAQAGEAEDLNAFVQALSIPVYAHHCEIMMDQAVMDAVNADVVAKMGAAGISEEKGVEIQTQMVEQFGANADCTEGSSDRTNFEAALAAYTGN